MIANLKLTTRVRTLAPSASEKTQPLLLRKKVSRKASPVAFFPWFRMAFVHPKSNLLTLTLLRLSSGDKLALTQGFFFQTDFATFKLGFSHVHM
jgi:hypothetical protein